MTEEPADDRAPNKPTEPSRSPAPQSFKMFRSEELFQGARIVCIEHAGSVYRLQITSRGKLILQK
jgi:hemin uptake protein HemP